MRVWLLVPQVCRDLLAMSSVMTAVFYHQVSDRNMPGLVRPEVA